MEFSLAAANTAAGLLAVGILIRYFVEVVKTLFAWVDEGRERFVVVGCAAVVYVAWYFQYGQGSVPDAAFVALACALSVILTAFGTNTAVDAVNANIVRAGRKATVSDAAPAQSPAPDPGLPVPDASVPVPVPPSDPSAVDEPAPVAP